MRKAGALERGACDLSLGLSWLLIAAASVLSGLIVTLGWQALVAGDKLPEPSFYVGLCLAISAFALAIVLVDAVELVYLSAARRPLLLRPFPKRWPWSDKLAGDANREHIVVSAFKNVVPLVAIIGGVVCGYTVFR